MKQYSVERKEALLRQMMPPQNRLVSELARESGMFAEQIATWRSACMSANASVALQTRSQQTQAKEDKKRIRQLEKDLQRKEKALAEAAALLILRKKAQAIWGDKEED